METVAIASQVTGNVGSCKIETSSRDTSSWRTETVAINSCTGEIVGRNEYFDGGNVILVVMVTLLALVMISAFFAFIKMIID